MGQSEKDSVNEMETDLLDDELERWFNRIEI